MLFIIASLKNYIKLFSYNIIFFYKAFILGVKLWQE
ncbi:hypothetical protein BP951000_0582 [Brachyspira pilosicoli 95/1000]|uniref:Uncharacterized protein n=1 Tax=Brachyspira pilosicoli (strain ATCC BAA-1826 / 95/1000) TaxID=759914 RepID=D8IBR0_BRAP9|nr:hypothetical protein BP951000_0582 [Brachyspira pilosicoli 95/1000]